ncbi:reprolysin family zinc metalloprotease, partial [Cooperia oncophora]
LQVLPLPRADEQGVLSSSSTLPDWSGVKRRSAHYVELLLCVDAALARHYGHEPERIRAAMLMLMHAVNMIPNVILQYAFQLGIRIVVVDVVPVHGYNVTLEQFLEWRQATDTIVPHDIAILIRHRYEGGIAYVNGVCKRTAVGIAGFFPEAPFEYASVFFHELSHLLGLSHSARADCHCSKKNRGSCLRIDGFDNECSAQALVDLLPTIECLTEPRELPRYWLLLRVEMVLSSKMKTVTVDQRSTAIMPCASQGRVVLLLRNNICTQLRTFARATDAKIGLANKT